MTRLQRAMPWALGISLAVNLLLIGFLAGHRLGRPQHGAGLASEGRWREHDAGLPGPRRLLRQARRAGAGEPLRKLMGVHREGLRENRRALQNARRRAAEAMAAEPYDPKAAAAALGVVREHSATSQAAAHRLLLELAEQLDPPTRKNLFQHSERRRNRWRGSEATENR
ncbi:MAG: periplasmic heavy metal sensor [Myxococcales bacterium]|nr:periplasmic heavy metal sensor [Myxococcales bacterium]